MADRRNGAQSPEEQVRALFEEAESSAAKAFEQLVGKPSFGQLLALSAENVAALTRMGFDAIDLLWRNLRLAGRADIVRLSRQLHRTEDKLERLLQEVETLRDEVARAQRAPAGTTSGRRAAAAGNGADRSSSRSKGKRASGSR